MTLPPLLFALALWFLGTAAVVWLDSRPMRTFRASFTMAGLLALAATLFVAVNAGDASPAGAYLGFTAAILIWGWHEMGFLMGFVAGPNRAPCPPDAQGVRRFRLATATVIHHEVALAAHLAVLAAISWGAANPTAVLTFALLFGMRLSAKLNLFLGVANLSDEIFPPHLTYLKSYFGRPAINALFPLSIAGGIGVAMLAWAWSAQASEGGAIMARMLAALAVLGVVEHLFLVLPLREGRMWRWASAQRPQAAVLPAKSE